MSDPRDPNEEPNNDNRRRPRKRLAKKKKSSQRGSHGRKLNYYEPHSPFQILLEERRLAKKLSTHVIASALSIPQSTFWIWLHSEQGYPSTRSFKPKTHIPTLARVLGVTADDIRRALDESRIQYTTSPLDEVTRARAQRARIRSELEALLQLISNDKRIYFRKEYLINQIQRAIIISGLGLDGDDDTPAKK